MNPIEGLKIKDNIIAVGKQIGPKNVVFASRMSNNRICIYLQSEQVADNIRPQN